MKHLATFYCDNDWDFSIYSHGDMFRLYPAREDNGKMFDITICNRFKDALIYEFNYFPTHEEISVLTEKLTKFPFLEF